MAQRIIKNFTNENFTIVDLGGIVVPANGAIDIGGDENRLIQLATSEDLLELICKGTDKIRVSDGTIDFTFSESIDLIRRIQTPQERDPQGRAVVKVDTRRRDYDSVFQGAGDNLSTKTIGGGTPFHWDFSTEEGLVPAPEGFIRKRVEWQFMDLIYAKGGTINYFNAPKFSYINMFLVAPTGYPYQIKTMDSAGNVIRTNRIATEETTFMRWVINYHAEGTTFAPVDLAVDAPPNNPAYSFMKWRAEFTTPDIPEARDYHGFFNLEIYRTRSIYLP